MFVTPFLKMTFEEQLGQGEEQQQDFPPDNSEYEEGEGMPVAEQEESGTSQAQVHEQPDPEITEQPDPEITEQPEPEITEEPDTEKEAKESDPLQGGACAEATTPTKQITFNNEHSKMSIEELEEGDENSEKQKSFDRKCIIIGAMLLLVIIAGAVGAVLINKFTAKTSVTFEFGAYFADHMVLQRAPSSATLYGRAAGYSTKHGHNTTVTLVLEGGGDQKLEYKGLVKNTGAWYVVLEPVSEPGPFTIRVTLDVAGGKTVELKDVLFGDVWLCAGQRNMQFSVSMLEEGEKERALADLEAYSDMRLMAVWPEKAFVARDEIVAPMLRWSKPSTKSLVGSTMARDQYFSHFSALCWLYGRRLYDELRHPIGLASATYYSSSVEDWVSADVVNECKIAVPYEPSLVYKSMVRPLQRTSLHGVIWYQGEYDAEEQSVSFYDCALSHLITEWREQWHERSHGATQQDFPFGIVQLAGYRNGSNQTMGYTDIRWQQTANYGFLPNVEMNNTFMAVAVDLVDEENEKHPKHKAVIADRLVRGALATVYGRMREFEGPRPVRYSARRSQQSLLLTIQASGGLDMRSNDGFEVCCADKRTDMCPMSYIEVLIAPNRKWVPAKIARQQNTQVTLTFDDDACADGKHVVAVRYLWWETPCGYMTCALYDAASGLPMAPYMKQGLIDDGDTRNLDNEPTKTLV